MFGNKKLKAEIKSLKSDIDRARQDTFIVLTEQKKIKFRTRENYILL